MQFATAQQLSHVRTERATRTARCTKIVSVARTSKVCPKTVAQRRFQYFKRASSEKSSDQSAVDEAEAFLYESGEGGRRLDDEQTMTWEEQMEAKVAERDAKEKAEAEEKGWENSKDGWKYAKSRGFLRDMWDLLDGQLNGKPCLQEDQVLCRIVFIFMLRLRGVCDGFEMGLRCRHNYLGSGPCQI
ncbi:hypothetical protein CYMTET_47111 [Cymbomonas tetramitiformis]|uniref:Uncharacterized protein n=1 Tax=Cymbomonas tetramitiformis TaxID=36881 RepID=A0AAE0EY22_9CHLO|nr:hypothetical protein CYMTET_47111 [Cymbomonas tetramitiformis]